MENWYDYPQYFDMVFRNETAAEVAFFTRAFDRFASGRVRRLLEPGCGSGRLVAAMAARGYQVTGLDLSQPMLDYLAVRLRRRNLKASLVRGDMTEMSLPNVADSAFCTFNTFRHLLSERDAVAHLRSTAEHVRTGGIYVLGFHLIPMDADTECIERWRASHGGTNVNVTLRVIDFNRRARQEKLRVTIKAVKRDGSIKRIASEFSLRLYTPSQARQLFQQVADVWEIHSIHDFDYQIDQPRELDEDLTDAVFILKRR
jgi:SAM-dependent methyltransferase